MMTSNDVASTTSAQALVAYVGTYTNKTSRGIYFVRLDPATGSLSAPELAAETRSPSFLAVSPDATALFACNEIGDFGGKDSGAVTAFAIDRSSWLLRQINQQRSGGSGPCYVALDREARNVLTANYGSGSVAVLPVAADNSLSTPSCAVQHYGSSKNSRRQAGPHAHSINIDPLGEHAVACDLGTDSILVYRFDAAAGTLTQRHKVPVAPGAGPRHLTWHPGGQYAYVCNEMGNSVTGYAYEAATGVLKEIETTTTLPQDFSGENTTAEIQVHPSGRFLYVSNRGHDSIAVFALNEGRLGKVGHVPTGGKTPRGFTVSPDGKYLVVANQNADTIVSFRIDQETGIPEPTGSAQKVSMPVCIKFLPH